MAQRVIVICFDGTYDETGLPDSQSNVQLLSNLVADQKCVHYFEGVGTRQRERIFGGWKGAGIRERIREAYCVLQGQYARETIKSELKVFVFGFSRGAYEARLFTGLTAYSGVPSVQVSEDYGMSAFFGQRRKKTDSLIKDGKYFNVQIECLGLWDTVNSTAEGDLGERTLPSNVFHAYHAMAIDERRKDFQLVRWDAGSRVEEVWFPGCHRDVGGGYPEHELSDIALGWMIGKASAHGLVFNNKAEILSETLPESTVPTVHDSYTGLWIPLGPSPRSSRPLDIFHRSVQLAMAQNQSYRPLFTPANNGTGETYYV